MNQTPLGTGRAAGYDAEAFARDFAIFKSMLERIAPDIRVVGPATTGEAIIVPATLDPGATQDPITTEELLAATPQPVFDIFSYHFYGAVSVRCASIVGPSAQVTADAALSYEWLSRADRSYAFYGGLHDRFLPDTPIWITEMADAACGGNPWASTFLDSFRLAYQLASLAEKGVDVVFHNALAAGAYALVDPHTFAPRPNYWVALLWSRLMGAKVLNPEPTKSTTYLYAHCLSGQPGGVTLLAINTNRSQPSFINIPVKGRRYTLTAPRLRSPRVRLNGQVLEVDFDGEILKLDGVSTSSGPVALPPTSISFLALPNAGNPAAGKTRCRHSFWNSEVI